uniref:(northern house mosquito) hypothetical protein n=1 Tax=Culex pipiens TaxID=7175 RepID=A0A8D8G8C7_CULPI
MLGDPATLAMAYVCEGSIASSSKTSFDDLGGIQIQTVLSILALQVLEQVSFQLSDVAQQQICQILVALAPLTRCAWSIAGCKNLVRQSKLRQIDHLHVDSMLQQQFRTNLSFPELCSAASTISSSGCGCTRWQNVTDRDS